MGRLAKAGHHKLLSSVVWVAPLLGTVATNNERDALGATSDRIRAAQ